MSKRLSTSLLAVPLATVFLSFNLHAASHTWSGLGLTGNWSIPANWSGNNPPAAGETPPVTLTFPAGAARLNNTNNIGGLVIDSILFSGSGYTLNGSGSGGDLTLLGGAGTTVLCFANTTNTVGASLNLTLSNNVQVTVNSPGALYLDGIVQGSGGMTKQGGGVLFYYGLAANTYTGSTFVRAGTLALYCGSLFFPQVAVPGFLEIGGTADATVQLRANAQLSSSAKLQLDDNGTLDLNGYSATCGPLTLNSGLVQSGNGTLTLNGDVNGAGGFIKGHLSLGSVTRHFSTTDADNSVSASISAANASAGIVVEGTGALSLESSNSFAGPVTVNSGTLLAGDSHAFGTGAGGVTVNAGAQLLLKDVGNGSPVISNVSLTLNGSGAYGAGALQTAAPTSTWAGPINLASDCVVGTQLGASGLLGLYLAGGITGPGGLTCGGTGPSASYRLSGDNDNMFSGPLLLAGANVLYLAKTSGATAVPGSLVIGNNSDAPNSASVALLANNQIANTTTVTVNRSGYFTLLGFNETIGGLNLAGGTIDAGSGSLLTLGGNISSSGPYWGTIAGTLSLGGATRTISGSGYIQMSASIVDGGGAAGLVMNGSGAISLLNSNAFSGTFTIQSGTVYAYNNFTFGTTAQGVVLEGNGCLEVDGCTISGESLTVDSLASVNLRFYSTSTWTGPVTLTGTLRAAGYSDTDQLTLSGGISGSSSFDFTGPGTLVLAGAQDNTYSGTTWVDAGKLVLQKGGGHRAVPGSCIIGGSAGAPQTAQVQFAGDNQMSPGPVGYVQVKNSGWLNLNNHLQTVPALLLEDSATVDSGAGGLLTLAGNVTIDASVAASPHIYGNLSLGGTSRTFLFHPNNVLHIGTYLTINAAISDGGAAAGLTAQNGRLDLAGANSFSGPVYADNTTLYVWNSKALGTADAGLVLTNGAWLNTYASLTNESLLTSGPVPCGVTSVGSNFWTGPIQVSASTLLTESAPAYAFIASGPVSGTGSLVLAGTGLVRFAGPAPNTLSGAITSGVNLFELAKANATAVYGSLRVTNGIVRLLAANQILDTAAVQVETNGTFHLNNFTEAIGDLSGAGSVNLGAGILTVGGANPTNVFSGVISGPGGELDKIGLNTLVLTGTNTYTSATLIKGGTLRVDGSQPASDVYVYAGATLGGNGTVGPLHSTGGSISPGNGPGKLTISGNAILDGSSKLVLELNGTSPGVGYDQLNNIGQLAANGATLQIVMGFPGAVGNQYVVVNHPSGLTSTLFGSLQEGDTLTANNGVTLRISYAAGDGNDTVLTQLTSVAAPQLLGVTRLGNGAIQLNGAGVPNLSYTVQASTNLSAANWVNLGSATADGLGAMLYADLQSTNYSRRFYRLVWP